MSRRLFPSLARKAVGDPAAVEPSRLLTGHEGRPLSDTWDTTGQTILAMERSVWAAKAINAIAADCATLPLIVRAGSDTGPPIEDHPLAALLNQWPNPDENAVAFRWRLSAQLFLSRQGAFIEVVRTRAGDLHSLWLLDPTRVQPIPGTSRLVDGFNVRRGRSERVTIPAFDPNEPAPKAILWVKHPHPIDPLAGWTPLQAAGLAIDLDLTAAVYNRQFLANDGRPGGILNVQGKLSPQVRREIEQMFSGGRNAGRVRVLNAEAMAYADTATTPRDAQWLEARAMARDEVLAALGVPMTVLGYAAERTYANAAQEEEVYWTHTIRDHLALCYGPLDMLDGDPTTRVTFDLSGVEALGRGQRERRATMRDEFTAGLITANEWRVANGLPPVDDRLADLLIGTPNMLPWAGDGGVPKQHSPARPRLVSPFTAG